jgi:hypothetical protein
MRRSGASAIDADTREIMSGDVVRHTNSGRIAVVVEIGRTHRDGTIEYRVHVDSDDEEEDAWWNSAHARRVRGRDPYRRYLAMRDAEDDVDRQLRRSDRPVLGRGVLLPALAWERIRWRLVNLRRALPSRTRTTLRDLGRGHWIAAADDCLSRQYRARDRSPRTNDSDVCPACGWRAHTGLRCTECDPVLGDAAAGLQAAVPDVATFEWQYLHSLGGMSHDDARDLVLVLRDWNARRARGRTSFPSSTSPTPSVEWSSERIADQFRAEIRARFEAENAAYRSEEAAGIERARRANPEWWAEFAASSTAARPSDGPSWVIYRAADLRIDDNCARIVLPVGWMIGLDFVRMFDDTSVAWTVPTLAAEVVGGVARVVVEVILVDCWDDARAAAWSAARSGRDGARP